jgi:hypothetical protein
MYVLGTQEIVNILSALFEWDIDTLPSLNCQVDSDSIMRLMLFDVE